MRPFFANSVPLQTFMDQIMLIDAESTGYTNHHSKICNLMWHESHEGVGWHFKGLQCSSSGTTIISEMWILALTAATLEIQHYNYDIYLLSFQSHISENKSECDCVRELYPQCKNYTDVYDQSGLLTDRVSHTMITTHNHKYCKDALDKPYIIVFYLLIF